jgi:membrane fusion protein (multidrug efflux system)
MPFELRVAAAAPTVFRNVLLALCGVLALTTLASCDSAPAVKAAAQKPPPPAVVVDRVQLMDLTEERQFTGRIEAIDKVQVRARVQGFLTRRAFEEGAEIKKGQLLFEIERKPYEIAVAEAEANLASARAGLSLAQQTYDRTVALAKRNTASKASLDTAESQLAQAKAQVSAQKASLSTARLNLSYTRITAPIDGRVGRTTYSVGNLVSLTSQPLVTLVGQDPMYVTFPVPQSLLLEVHREGLDPNGVTVRLRLSDGSIYKHPGHIQFADVVATSSTDSVTVRAVIPNPERLLVDQQLVNVSVIRKKPEKRLVVSQSAIAMDQQGPYVLAVGKDNKVMIKRIKVGEQRGSLIIVNSGLAENDRVIVRGQQKVRPGMVVTASLAQTADASTPSRSH